MHGGDQASAAASKHAVVQLKHYIAGLPGLEGRRLALAFNGLALLMHQARLESVIMITWKER